MCGIAGFVTNSFESNAASTGWLEQLSDAVSAAPAGLEATPTLQSAVTTLQDRFSELMSFATSEKIAFDAGFRACVTALADAFKAQTLALTDLSKKGRTDLDPLIESLRDYEWQLREELVAQTGEAIALIPADGDAHAGHAAKVALATEHVLRSIDRLEVRGRDSAGIAVQIQVPGDVLDALDGDAATALAERRASMHAGHLSVYVHENGGGTATLTFVYKTANLVGKLGDNGAALRAAIREDRLLWALAKDYGKKDIVYSGPLFKSMKVEGGRAILDFDHAEGIKSRDNKPLTHFELLTADGKWFPAGAYVHEGKVIISSKAVRNPISVRFGWDQLATPNLVNGAGLPASPFTAKVGKKL